MTLLPTVNPVDDSARLVALRRYDILDTPPDGSFDRITALAASLFDVPISIISLVDHDRTWFKSHHGLDVTQIGKEPGLCASAVLQDDAWVLENASVDIRSLANPLVAGEFGLRFYAGIPLKTFDGFNLGTLCVMDREPRAITQRQIAQLTDLASVVMDQMELRLAARHAVGELSAAIEQKERALVQANVLTQEIDHRVMNSLQLVSSLLGLQARQAGPEVGEQLAQAAARVTSVAHVHQHILRNADGATAGSRRFLTNLANELRTMLGGEAGRSIEVDAVDIPFSSAQLVPLGLVVNELLTNAYKHGNSAISLLFRRLDSGDLELSVVNQGGALPANFDPQKSGGLGMKVVSALARQLGGSLTFGSLDDGSGVRFSVLIPSSTLN